MEAELEKEKKEIESSRQGNSASFRKKLDEKLKEEEDKVWDALQGELVQLREKLKQDVEEKKKALELAHEKELDVVKTNTKEDQDRLMKDLRKASKDEVDLLKSQLDAERDKVRCLFFFQVNLFHSYLPPFQLLKEARVETEKKFNTEEMKAKIEESFKVTEAEMEERVSKTCRGVYLCFCSLSPFSSLLHRNCKVTYSEMSKYNCHYSQTGWQYNNALANGSTRTKQKW